MTDFSVKHFYLLAYITCVGRRDFDYIVVQCHLQSDSQTSPDSKPKIHCKNVLTVDEGVQPRRTLYVYFSFDVWHCLTLPLRWKSLKWLKATSVMVRRSLGLYFLLGRRPLKADCIRPFRKPLFTVYVTVHLFLCFSYCQLYLYSNSPGTREEGLDCVKKRRIFNYVSVCERVLLPVYWFNVYFCQQLQLLTGDCRIEHEEASKWLP